MEYLKISFFLLVVLEIRGNYGEPSEINIAHEQASLAASAWKCYISVVFIS